MLRAAYAVIIGLFGAGIVHIAILLLIPEFSERDAWSRLAMASDFYTVTPLDTEVEGSPIVKSVDPLFVAAACRFDISQGVMQLRSTGTAPFWSASVYNRAGQNIYSLNNSSSASGQLDFVVLSAEQMIELRKDLPEEFLQSVFVEAPVAEGIVVVRAFMPDATWKPAVDRYFSEMSCSRR